MIVWFFFKSYVQFLFFVLLIIYSHHDEQALNLALFVIRPYKVCIWIWTTFWFVSICSLSIILSSYRRSSSNNGFQVIRKLFIGPQGYWFIGAEVMIQSSPEQLIMTASRFSCCMFFARCLYIDCKHVCYGRSSGCQLHEFAREALGNRFQVLHVSSTFNDNNLISIWKETVVLDPSDYWPQEL